MARKTNPRSITYTTRAKRELSNYPNAYPYFMRSPSEELSLKAGSNLIKQDRKIYKENPTKLNLHDLHMDLIDHRRAIKFAAKDMKRITKEQKKGK